MIDDIIEMIPVSRLVPAPENVRKTNADAGHASLVAMPFGWRIVAADAGIAV